MSGRKSNLKQYELVAAASMTTSITSPVTSIEFLDNIGYQIDYSGSPVGTFSVQVSADYNQDYQGNVMNAGSWVTVPVTYWNGTTFVDSTTIPTTVSSPVFVNLNQLSAPWVRVVYTFASGSGSLNIWVCGKML